MTTPKREIEVVNDKVIMTTSGIKMQYEGKDVGTRIQIDEYNKGQIQKIMDDLTTQLKGAQDQRELAMDSIVKLKKQFNLKSKNKYVRIMREQQELKVYMDYKKQMEAITSGDEAIKLIEKDLKDLTDLEK